MPALWFMAASGRSLLFLNSLITSSCLGSVIGCRSWFFPHKSYIGGELPASMVYTYCLKAVKCLELAGKKAQIFVCLFVCCVVLFFPFFVCGWLRVYLLVWAVPIHFIKGWRKTLVFDLNKIIKECHCTWVIVYQLLSGGLVGTRDCMVWFYCAQRKPAC